MVIPSVGRVVIVPFPFSDLTQTKLRPAICLADVGQGDWILCQVTSQPHSDPMALAIAPDDFASGGLAAVSWARPGKLFTFSTTSFRQWADDLTPSARDRVLVAVAALFQPPGTL